MQNKNKQNGEKKWMLADLEAEITIIWLSYEYDTVMLDLYYVDVKFQRKYLLILGGGGGGGREPHSAVKVNSNE